MLRATRGMNGTGLEEEEEGTLGRGMGYLFTLVFLLGRRSRRIPGRAGG